MHYEQGQITVNADVSQLSGISGLQCSAAQFTVIDPATKIMGASFLKDRIRKFFYPV